MWVSILSSASIDKTLLVRRRLQGYPGRLPFSQNVEGEDDEDKDDDEDGGIEKGEHPLTAQLIADEEGEVPEDTGEEDASDPHVNDLLRTA